MPEPKKEWKVKKDENGVVVFNEDKPVYIDPEGKELPLDPVNMYTKIIDLGKESQKHREAANAASEKLKVFEGIEDLPDWKRQADEAMEKIANFNDKDWLKAEKVEKLKDEMASSYSEKLTNVQNGFSLKEKDYKTALSTKDAQMRKLMITNLFSTSPYFSGSNPKTTLPPAIAESYFGKNFKVEEDEKTKEVKLVAYHDSGEVVLSRERPGEIANLSEAMTAIFEASPFKDQLLKSSGGGSGAGGGQGDSDSTPGSELAKLEKRYADAQASHDGRLAITLKGQIHALRSKMAA